MSDVSCRAFKFFETFENDERVDLDRLVVGLPITRRELANPLRRIPWPVWVEICERFGRQIGSPSELQASGGAVVASEYLGPILGLLGIFTEPRDLYRVGARWFAPMMYRNLHFSVHEPAGGPLEFRVEVPANAPGSKAFMRMTAGGLQTLPRLLGLPDASIEAEITPHTGRFFVSVPQQRTARSLLGRAWAATRGASAVIAELAEQQARLAESYAALSRAERGFRSALDALPVAVGVHRSGKLLYANSALGLLVGDSSLVGTQVFDLLHDEDRKRLLALLHRPGTPATIEATLAGAKSPVSVECGVLDGFVFDGAPAGLFFAIDLTARRAAQEALARSEGITKMLLDVLPDLVLRVDAKGTLLEFRAGRGHPRAKFLESFVGASVFGIVELLSGLPRQIVEDGLERVREALATGRETAYELQSSALEPDRHYDCRIMPEGPDEVVVLVRDVTELRRMEQQLAITERMATLGTVAASVAHELNNPLTFVVANISLALEEVDRANGPRGLDLGLLREGLLEARDGAGRVRRIVEDLRVFSRGGSTQELRPTAVRDVLDSVIAMTQAEVRERARIVLVSEGSVLVDVDPARLGQVLMNLILNAAQAIPEAEAGKHEIRIRASIGADGWQEIAVSDDGVGIAPELLGQIFQPFVTTKRERGGTGLGLAICHRIVAELGGRIEVESTFGSGTTFIVRLPPSAGAQEVSDVPPSRPAERPPARLLIVDDEPLVARSVMRILNHHQTVWAANGDEAIERLRNELFDLVICDIMLGGKTGLDVREAARCYDPALADRFLFMSGGALTQAAQDLVTAEPERCISKPFVPAELRQRVDEELARLSRSS